MESEIPRLTVTTKLWYGVGQIAEGIKNYSFGAFLLFYYTQVLGLSGTVVGGVVFIALLMDAITDPLAGNLSDHFQSVWGRRHPFMYAAALPLALAFYFLFSPPAYLEGWGLAAWLLTFTVLARTAMTLYSVPHLALGAELSDDYDERTGIVAFRSFLGISGGIGAGVIGLGWYMRPTPEYPSGQLNPEAYPAFALSFAIAIFVTIIASGIGTHRRIRYLHMPEAVPGGGALRGLYMEISQALQNKSFQALFIGSTIFATILGVHGVLGLHMGTYFWALETNEILYFTVAAGLGIFVGLPIWSLVSRRLDKKPTFLLGVIWFTAFSSIPPLLRVAGLLPDSGTPIYVALVVAVGFLMAFGGGAAGVTMGSMMADITDEDALRMGRRREGIFFGALSFSAKAATGLGQFFGGFLIDAAGLSTTVDPDDISQLVIRNLGLFYGFATFAFAVAAFYFLSRYDLSRSRHTQILSQLARRTQA